MKILTKMKRKLAFQLQKSENTTGLFKMLEALNLVAFHWSERMHKVSYGEEDPHKTYYVIKPRVASEGLLSLYFYVVRNIRWANKMGYIPYVDFQDTKCQYYTGNLINGTYNAWEYYFEQPENLTKEEVHRKKNVIVSGFQLKGGIPFIGKTLDDVTQEDLMKIYSKIQVQQYITDMANQIYKEKYGEKCTIGVFIRGTDYVKLKPKNHPIQPTIEMLMQKVDEYIRKYNPDSLFVVTEDYDYYCTIKEKYGDMVTSSDECFAYGYNGSYISDAFSDDPYERGLKYLIRLILLSKCDYLVSSVTNGSLFSYCIKQDTFQDSYWFDLGLYS